MQNATRRVGAERAHHQAGHYAMGVRLPYEPDTNRFAPLQSEPLPDWSELPLELLSIVFEKLGAAEVLMGVGIVCRSWLEAAKAPDVWRSVDMKWLPWSVHMKHHKHGFLRTKKPDVARTMAKSAVHRSNGRIESFAGDGDFVTDELLEYIAEQSSCLKSLSLSGCMVSNKGFLELITKSPLLEELLVFQCRGITEYAYKVAFRACPQLKRLVLYR